RNVLKKGNSSSCPTMASRISLRPYPRLAHHNPPTPSIRRLPSTSQIQLPSPRTTMSGGASRTVPGCAMGCNWCWTFSALSSAEDNFFMMIARTCIPDLPARERLARRLASSHAEHLGDQRLDRAQRLEVLRRDVGLGN